MKEVTYLTNFFLNVLQNIQEEIHAWYVISRANKLLIIILLSVVALLLTVFNPLPPAKVYLGTGQAGTSYRMLGE